MKQIEWILESLRNNVCHVDPSSVNLEDPKLNILDCRDPEEFHSGYIAGAVNLPRAQLELRVEEVIKDKSHPVLVYCASGTRSLLATRTLTELGYQNVCSLAGGIQGWKAAGRPVLIPTTFSTISAFDRKRYQSQMQLPEIGEQGQQRIRAARVLIIGAGGLGSPVALYLTAAGIGTIGIVDHDKVDYSNLQRQILHTSDRVGVSKVDSAFMALRALNSEVHVERYGERLTQESAESLFPRYDLIVDCSDNFTTRYLINRVCHRHKKRCIHGSVFQWQGQVSVFGGGGPCYECLFPLPPSGEMAPNCAEAGVIGALTGVVGAMMACETLKIICELPTTLTGRLASFDLKQGSFETLQFKKDADCACCAHP